MSGITPGDGDPRHGTINGYRNLACRCVRCRDAHAAWMREWRRSLSRERRSELTAAGQPAQLARLRALTRLGRMYPQDYERLVNEERAAEGLPPLSEVVPGPKNREPRP